MSFSFLRPLALPRVATLRAFFSTTAVSKAAPIPIITASASSSTKQFIPASEPGNPSNLPYHVQRTPSKLLPIYLLRKRGGNLHQTRIRKITGDVLRLRLELQDYLKAEKADVVVNSLTGHIIVKGHRKTEVTKFLEARKF